MSDSGGDTVRRNSMLVKTVRVKFDNRLQRSFLQFRVFNQLADTFSLSPQLSPVDNVHDFFPRPVLQIAKDKMSLTLPGWENIKVRFGYFFVADYLGYILMCFVAMKRT